MKKFEEVQSKDTFSKKEQILPNFNVQKPLDITNEQHEMFFRNMLGDIDEPTAPFGLTNIKVGDTNFLKSYLQLYDTLAERIRECAKIHGVNPASLFHLAWSLVLALTSGRQDVVFGTVILGQKQNETSPDCKQGLFSNILPIRIKINEDNVLSSVKSVHTLLIELMEHKHASLTLAQGCSGVASEMPLFTAIMNYRYPAECLEKNLECEEMDYRGGHDLDNYPISITIDEFSTDFTIEVQSNSSVFPERICNFMLSAIERLIDALEEDPRTLVNCIDILPDEERQTLLYDWNATKSEYPKNKCIQELFEEQVEKTPDNIAVVFEDVRLTYRELNEKANQLAHYLIENYQIQPDDLVGVLMDRSEKLIIVLLGILKSGAGYLPIDSEHPAQRIKYILEDAGAKAVIICGDVLKNNYEITTPILDIDSVKSYRKDNLGKKNTAHNLVYVIYTSGSTGRPKGTLIEHGSLTARLTWLQETYPIEVNDKILLKTTYTFDVSVSELFWWMLSGSTLVVLAPGNEKDPMKIAEIIEKYAITHINFVPSMLTVFLSDERIKSDSLKSLKYVFPAGEALQNSSVKRFFNLFDKNTQMHNLYGPTEATIYSIAYRCQNETVKMPSVPIGKPISNTMAYIINPQTQQLLPVGIAGELCLAGIGLARGYLNQPDLTDEKFVQNPFIPGEKMYRTGDLARWLPDGNIEYLGRTDFQVKVRGFRIELGEIEAQLAEHPHIQKVAVIAREDTPGDKRLVAYYVADEVLSIEEMKNHLSVSLPEYMVPAAYIRLDTMPLTSSGKLDRKSLPLPKGDAYLTRTYEPPQGETEQTIAQIWLELLRIEKVGRYDNFFELGGHSLLAITLIERLRKINLYTDIRNIFTSANLAYLAIALTTKPEKEIIVPPNQIKPDTKFITPDMIPLINLTQQDIDHIVDTIPGGISNIQDIYALGPMQEGMLFHHLLEKELDPYTIGNLMAFDSRERLDKFLDSMQNVIDRHDILRTSMVWKGLTEPAQVVWRKAVLPIQEVILFDDEYINEIDINTIDFEKIFYEGINPVRYRFDLEIAPFLRAFITYDLREKRWLLLLLEHHLLGDSSIISITREEIIAFQNGQADILLTPKPFRNYIAQTRLGKTKEEHEAFFRNMLADIDEPTVPFGAMNNLGDTRDVVKSSRQLNDILALRIRKCAKVAGVSAASLFHLAWALVLSISSGRQNVVFGTVLFGRMQGGRDSDSTLGVFINTLPMRVELGRDSVLSTAKRLHALLIELMAHEHASLMLAQRCSGVASGMPLFTALMNYRQSSEKNETSDNWEGIEVLTGSERDNYPISMSVDDLGTGFSLTAQTDFSISPERVCDFMNRALEVLVETFERDHDTPTYCLDVLPKDEWQTVLYDWNATKTDYPKDKCIHELFEDQVAKTPNAVAVVYDNEQLTYKELNSKANKLAHYLKTLGVGPDSLVGLSVERGLNMIIGIMGILKSGGAYVPLDHNYPSERLIFMLEDCKPVAVVLEPSTSNVFTNIDSQKDMVNLTLDQNKWDDLPDTNLEICETGLSPGNLAYIIYTSGTTGQPKGVMIEHGGLVNQIIGLKNHYAINSDDCILQFSRITFDMSVEEIFPALVSGARLVIRTDAWLADYQKFWGFCQDKGITIINLPTKFWSQLIQDEQGNFPPTLRQVMITGEAVSHTELLKWFKYKNRPRLFNVYGPTETTVNATIYEPLPKSVCPQSIGRPVANTYAYILDRNIRPVPIGVAGELYIGGVNVGRGYMNRSKLTTERFVPDPFVEVKEDNPMPRMYKTGDLVRWLPDGNIEYLGRTDFQVKIRGFRIELGEIEVCLASYPHIREAAVAVREDVLEDKQLVGYYVAEKMIPIEELRKHMSKSLPEYMIPAAYIKLDAMPLTPSGKLDRKALPAPGKDAYMMRPYEPPQGEIEEIIAETWSHLFKLEKVGRDDNFFELGGHSLLSIKLMGLLRQKGIDIAITMFFKYPTIKLLASYIADKKENINNSCVQVRSTGAQSPLFFIHEIMGDAEVYALRLVEYLDKDIPVYALNAQPIDEGVYKTAEAIAKRHIQKIKEVQPKGPYRLAGWSFGGILAYEVALQLIGQDETVEFLGLLDTHYFYGLSKDEPRSLIDNEINEELDFKLYFLKFIKGRGYCKSIMDEILRDFDSMSIFQLVKKALNMFSDETDSSIEEDIKEIARLKIYDEIDNNYYAHKLPIKPYLFSAQEHIQYHLSRGWDTFLSEDEIKVIPVPGDHFSMTYPPLLKNLCEAISQVIQECSNMKDGDNKQKYEALVTIQKGNSGESPIFCVPGSVNNAESFSDLANSLGPFLPVYGFQPRGLAGELIPHQSVSVAANTYIQEIQNQYPKGPIHLLGHSFGGWIVFEMAQQLCEKGRDVLSVTMVETEIPDKAGCRLREYSRIDVLMKLVDIYEQIAGKSLNLNSKDFNRLNRSEQDSLLLTRLVLAGLMPKNTLTETLDRIIYTFESHLRTHYTPKDIYQGDVNLIFVKDTTQSQFSNEEIAQEWKYWAPNLTYKEMECNHMTILKSPHVNALAELLKFQIGKNVPVIY